MLDEIEIELDRDRVVGQVYFPYIQEQEDARQKAEAERKQLYIQVKEFEDTTSDNEKERVQQEIERKQKESEREQKLTEYLEDTDKKIKSDLSDYKKEVNDIISAELKFHAVAKSSATYIVEFPNGKNMFIDTGMANQWNDIKAAIDGLGITKFDYGILTHFHSDHVDNVQRFFDTYDLNECTIFVGMKPDFINHASDLSENESNYDNCINLLSKNGIRAIVPENDSYFFIDENTKLHFLNTSPELAESYYGNITEYRTERKLNFNHFSLVTEIFHFNNVVLVTGDIERCVEEAITPYVHKCNVITSPHHGVNRDAYKGFYNATSPDYAISMYISESDTWVHNYYKSFIYLQESGCKMITARWTEPVDGLYSFFLTRDNVTTGVLGESNYFISHETAKMYSTLHEIIDFTKQLQSEITLEDLFEKMIPGSSVITTWWATYNTTYTSLYEELQILFPTFTNGYILELRKDDSHYKQVIVRRNNELEFIAESYLSDIKWTLKGSGLIPDVTGTNKLVSTINNLPKGNYTMNSYMDDSSGVLVTDGAYNLSINISSTGDTMTTAQIIGVLRHTGTAANDKCRAFIGYINTSNSPKYIFHKINS